MVKMVSHTHPNHFRGPLKQPFETRPLVSPKASALTLLERTRLLKERCAYSKDPHFDAHQAKQLLRRAARDLIEKKCGPFWRDYSFCNSASERQKCLKEFIHLLKLYGYTRWAQKLEVLAPRPQSHRRSFFRDFLYGAVFALALNTFCTYFIFRINIIRGVSMQPAFEDGDRVIVDKLNSHPASLQRFDPVTFRYPKQTNVDFIKRVIGLPGEKVRIQNGVLYINDQIVEQPFLRFNDECFFPESTVPKDHFFVLGDNRPISCDSREFGFVPFELLHGKVRVCYWPPSRWGIR